MLELLLKCGYPFNLGVQEYNLIINFPKLIVSPLSPKPVLFSSPKELLFSLPDALLGL